jgi:hypothetical protein
MPQFNLRRPLRAVQIAGTAALSGNLTVDPGTDPYTWFTSLDKNIIPFHAGSGVWGSQSQIVEAAAPTGTMVDVTAANAAELATHIYTANRRITLTGNITNGTFNAGNITDVDIIVPPGIVMNSTTFGRFDGSRTITRLRVRGNTVGSYSGGQVHRTYIFGPANDVIFDGVAMSGRGGNEYALVMGFSNNRLAVTNVRAQCGGYFYIGTTSNATFTNCSILTGVDTVSQLEAWGIRFSHEALGNLLVYGCDIRSSTNRTTQAYHRIRCHPDPGLNYVWVHGNTLVDRVENRIFWCDAAAGTGTGDALGVWFTGNNIVATRTASQVPDISGADTNYAYVQDNTFQSNTFLSDSNISLTGITNGSAGRSGNVYQSLPGSDPAWGAAGDPTGINWNI